MRTPTEHIKTLQRRIDFLKSREHINSFDKAEVGSLEWALVNLSAQPKEPEQEQQIETLKRCLFQMQEAAKDLVEQAKSLTPPQRTWVVLTDDEIMDMYNEPRSDAEMIAFGREVEAKLKEKNNG